MLLISILAIALFVELCVSLIQINFLKKEKEKKAIILSESDYKNAANIAIDNQKFHIFSLIYDFLIKICFIMFGFVFLKQIFISENSTLENTLFLLAFLVLLSVLNLPLSIYESFVKDKKSGFSNMNAALFIKDSLKSLALLVVFGFLIIYALLFLYEFFGAFWWLAAFAFSFVVILIINLIYPTLIAPIFNKMQKLEDENLLNKISSLMQKCGFNANGVFIIDASKRDKRLNAYFGGLFKNKRVVLFDTLLKALSEKELLAVLGHELGHFVHKDLIKGLFSSALMLFVLFFILANLPEIFYKESNLSGVNAGVFVLLILLGGVFNLITSPFLNLFSRKHEFSADEFGAKMSCKEDMKAALISLARENKAFVKTSRAYTIFHLSHPCINDRIKALS